MTLLSRPSSPLKKSNVIISQADESTLNIITYYIYQSMIKIKTARLCRLVVAALPVSTLNPLTYLHKPLPLICWFQGQFKPL